MKVAIIYGWSEGPWQGQRFKAALAKTGLEIVKNPLKADIIIAHSEGCYWLPGGINPKLIALIGLPHWPGRSLITSTILNLIANAKTESRQDLSWWAAKLIHNVFYIFSRPNLTWRLLSRHNSANIPILKTGQKGLLIRASKDTYCSPNIQDLLPKLKPYVFKQIAGVHDDCWATPGPYIKLIKENL